MASNVKQNRGQDSAASDQRSSHTDTREIVETVVFVMILVTLLRMFGAEAFVIPTGSMATTLLGAHKTHTCPKCGYSSYFNASEEAEEGRIRAVLHGVCQNCREELDLHGDSLQTGDRVVVGKFVYEGFTEPQRWDVVVFKCLESMRSLSVPEFFPRDNRTHGVMNYIKRLVGLPGETIRIKGGDIYIMGPQDQQFSIASKPPHVIMAVRRLVFDNDHQPVDLLSYGSRWQAEDGVSWIASEDLRVFECETQEKAWLRYRHLPNLRRIGRDGSPEAIRLHAEPELITDFEAYNDDLGSPMNWVGDLMIDCTVGVKRMSGSVILELNEGLRQYHCILDLDKQRIVLTQNGQEIAAVSSPIQSTGDWDIRFANFDDQLTVWVEEDLVFGDGVAVATPLANEMGPRVEDVSAVGIAAENTTVAISKLKLFRDIYYTQGANRTDVHSRTFHADAEAFARLREYLQELPPEQYSIGEDEFFMLGDNSPRSSDSRAWEGTNFVHRRLLLGRALVLYWPAWRWKFVR